MGDVEIADSLIWFGYKFALPRHELGSVDTARVGYDPPMGDEINPWELLDNTANVIEVAGAAIGAAYWLYRNRVKVTQIAAKLQTKQPVQLTGGTAYVRAPPGGGKIRAVSHLAVATVRVSHPADVIRAEPVGPGYSAWE
jgi:hypothetical protein